MSALPILLLWVAGQTTGADRATHLASAIEAMRVTQRDVLERAHGYAAVLERGACASGSKRLKVECLMTASRRYCQKKTKIQTQRCHAYMDIVVSNVLAEEQFIPTEQRYDIMRQHKDYRGELNQRLRRMQGTLAVDFRLRMGEAADDATLAKHIDQYCLLTSDETGFAWQTCASTLVWFIAQGTS